MVVVLKLGDLEIGDWIVGVDRRIVAEMDEKFRRGKSRLSN